jgi:hypothetical protein
MDSTGSGKDPMTGFCEHDNGPTVSVNLGEILTNSANVKKKSKSSIS